MKIPNHPDGAITTATGRLVKPLDLDPATIEPRDLAHALAHRARFAGHAPAFYSVAQHSVLVSKHLPPEAAPWGLLHDAAEAYLPDVARPIKGAFWVEVPHGFGRALVPFRDLEKSILAAVAERFGLPWPIPPEVTTADRAALAAEQRYFFGPQRVDLDLPAPLPEPIRPWPWELARAAWMEAFCRLVQTPADPAEEPYFHHWGEPDFDDAD